MDKKFEEQIKNQVQYPLYILENIRKKKDARIALENKKKEIDNVLEQMAELKLKTQNFSYKKNFGSNIMVNKLKNCKNVTRETKMVDENSMVLFNNYSG